jgi:hypothetical protein
MPGKRASGSLPPSPLELPPTVPAAVVAVQASVRNSWGFVTLVPSILSTDRADIHGTCLRATTL